ncbi:hypothetical protein MCEKH37_01185 [Methylophilaceae bacterium]
MNNEQLQTPVVFIIFNRPDTTLKVFNEIAKVKPKKLLVIADGPRIGKPNEAENCKKTRDIINQIDWPCEVLRNYSEVNLGCKRRVSSGISWAFDQVEEAIFLEDDCLPDISFFYYCEELLGRYRYDESVGVISGDNFQFGKKRGDASYYFSKYVHIWGWASWRRAWQYYDVDIKSWPKYKANNLLDKVHVNKHEIKFWTDIMDSVHGGKIDTWDYQWVLAHWANDMKSIIPQVNLISNIGFGDQATHTKNVNEFANMESKAMEFPLIHSNSLCICKEADVFTKKIMFSHSIMKKVIKLILTKIYQCFH